MFALEQPASMPARWVELLARYGVGEVTAQPILGRLLAAYSTPDRYYHTLEHLAEMFAIIDRLAPDIDDRGTVQLAIWFHDAVYDTQRKDNEERSAQLARELLAPLSLSVAVVDRVERLVRATAHLGSDDPSADRDIAALLDADLAILGAAPERYLRYLRDIRREYGWVPELEYRAGRAAVLQKFLARPRIYQHPITFEEREDQARKNLAGELKLLGEVGTLSPPRAL